MISTTAKHSYAVAHLTMRLTVRVWWYWYVTQHYAAEVSDSRWHRQLRGITQSLFSLHVVTVLRRAINACVQQLAVVEVQTPQRRQPNIVVDTHLHVHMILCGDVVCFNLWCRNRRWQERSVLSMCLRRWWDVPINAGRVSSWPLYNMGLGRHSDAVTSSWAMENDDDSPGDTFEKDTNASEDQLDDIHRYVRHNEYRSGLSKDQKRRVREKALCFSDNDGVLMRTNKQGAMSRFVRTAAEKDHIVHEMHAGVLGGAHFGQDATIRKV